MNDSKSGKTKGRLWRRVLAPGLTIAILLALALLLSGLGALSAARAQDDSARALSASSDTLAEWRVFLVATNNYYDPDEPKLSALRYAEDDVASLEKIFKALGVKDENITVLKSSNSSYYTQSNKESIEKSYQRFLGSLTEKSIAFVFLSGHGFTEIGTKRSYYLPMDYASSKSDEKRISIDDMMTELAASKARFKWICVDACRNEIGGKRGKGGESSLSIEGVPKGTLLTQSCSRGQFSYEFGKSEGAPSDNGVFTRVFVDAISGRDPSADTNQDGLVTLGELRDYVCKQAPIYAKKYRSGAVQNPDFTSLDGAFEEFANTTLFEDRDWRKALSLCEDAEKLVQQQNYAVALDTIREAYSLRPKDPGIGSLKDEIERLFNENDVNQKAEAAYKKAQEALNAKRYDESRNFIGEALRLKPNESTYDLFKKLIDAQEKMDEGGSDSSLTRIEMLGQVPSLPNRKPGDLLVLTINGVRVAFRWCPPGEFVMGSPKTEVDRGKDETQHNVVVTKGFWMAETETSQELWKATVKINPSSHKDDAYPVENITWDDCQEFIAKLNENSKGVRFKLPTEAHWEYACRAGTSTPYSWGERNGESYANYSGVGSSWATPVGRYDFSNAWHLKDMHGNVWEWCEDFYGAYPKGTATDPMGPDKGALRVNRGGSYEVAMNRSRSANRNRNKQDFCDESIGFRLELSDFSPAVFTVAGVDGSDHLTPEFKAGERRTVVIAEIETNFRWCPPGRFMMGSPDDEEGRLPDEIWHEVILTRGFWLCEFPVTVKAFELFAKATGYKTRAELSAEKNGGGVTWREPGSAMNQTPLHPVVYMSYQDAQEYIKWLNENYAPNGMRFQLPSEAHWEYACRAGTETAYWWGNDAEDGKGKMNVADESLKALLKEKPITRVEGGDWSFVSYNDGYSTTNPMGSNKANGWGLEDMLGNVCELCEDKFGNYPPGSVTDPIGNPNGYNQVKRGGSFGSHAKYCRSASRYSSSAWLGTGEDGFRLELVYIEIER